jgi:hypothetical protein
MGRSSRSTRPPSLPGEHHYVGMRAYTQLPELIGEWDVAMMPFAHNESPRV